MIKLRWMLFLIMTGFMMNCAADDLPVLRFTSKQKVVFDGDSGTSRRTKADEWTWPFLQLMDWEHTWADYMGQLMFCWRPDLNLSFNNSAIGGSRSDEILARADRVIKCKPDWVLVTIGGNDCSVQMPLETFRSNIVQYVERIHTETKANIVFIINRYEAPDQAGRFPEKAGIREKRQTYLNVLVDEAFRRDYVAALDITAFLKERVDLIYQQHKEHTILNDGGHYNNVGAVTMAGAVMAAFDVFPAANRSPADGH